MTPNLVDRGMSTVLSIVWFAAAIGGAIAGVVGLSTHRARRRVSLVTAGVCLGVAGLLGILSIGIIFVALSAACFVASSRAGEAPATTTSAA